MLSQDMPPATDEREERADRWQRQLTDRLLVTEPDWWLRMECGQVLQTLEASRV